MVHGKLEARGTQAEPIRFTKQASQQWGRIIFSDQSADCTIDDADKYAAGCVLERCILEQGEGLIIESSSPLIKNCEITENKGSGITVRQGGPVITGNRIHDNAARTNGGGVYAYTNDIIYITKNKIYDNHADGDGGGVFAYGYMNMAAIQGRPAYLATKEENEKMEWTEEQAEVVTRTIKVGPGDDPPEEWVESLSESMLEAEDERILNEVLKEDDDG